MFQNSDSNRLRYRVFEAERFVDLNPYQFGWERCEPQNFSGPYISSHYLFHFVLSGAGALDVEGNQYPIKAKQGFFVFPEQYVSYMADKQEPWEYIWLELDGMLVWENLLLAGISVQNPVWTAAETNHANMMEKQMKALINRGPHKPSPLEIIGYCFLLLDLLALSSVQREHTVCSQDTYVKEAILFIKDHFHKNISIPEIASACGLSQGYLVKIFKESLGESPQQFLLQYRMMKAAHLLKKSQLPIHEISAMVSYSNQQNFSRAFELIYRVTPQIYRQKFFIAPDR